MEKLTKENSEIKNDYTLLKTEVESKDARISGLEEKLTKTENKLSESENLYETEKAKKEKLNARLKYCKEKLAKCNSSITQLKSSKLVLLKTVSDYSESVPKWQQDIMNASKLLSEQLLKLEFENNELKAKLASQVEAESSSAEKEEDIQKTMDECDQATSKFNSISKKYKKLEEEHRVYAEKIKSLKSENETHLNNLKSLESEKHILVNEKKTARETIQKLEAEKLELQNSQQELTDNVAFLKAEMKKLKICKDNLEKQKAIFAEDLQTLRENKFQSEQALVAKMNEELISLRSALVSVEEENKLLLESNEMLKSQLDTGLDEQKTPEMRRIMEQNDLLHTDISKLQTKIVSFKNENTSLLTEVKESRQKLSELEAVLQDHESIKSKMTNYKSENAELLKEMKEINQALKERGETISKQYMEISELNRKVQLLEDEIKKAKNVSEHKDGEIKKMQNKADDDESEKQNLSAEKDNLSSHWQALLNERDHIIISLQEDIEKLKQNQGNHSFGTYFSTFLTFLKEVRYFQRRYFAL